MKKTLNAPRVLSSMVAVALLGLIVGSPAWGEDNLFGSYTVPFWKNSTGEHRWAIFAVYKSERDEKHVVLSFMQTRGTYKNEVFICDNAKWDSNNQSYSCSVDMKIGGNAIIETMTVGKLDGEFCNGLRTKHKKKIIKREDCKKGEHCSCYAVTHKMNDRIDFAPSPGAGTGKGN